MKSFEEVMQLAVKQEPKKIAVACAQDEEVLVAVEEARKRKIATAILVGDEEKIRAIASEMMLDLSFYEVIHETDLMQASRKAVELVSSGKADLLMKGLVDTSIIMKAVLDKEIGLRTGKPLSHVSVFEIEGWDRLLFLSDGAMTLAPDLEGKKKIIENAVSLVHSLGIKEPKVAVLCAKEKVDEKMSCTVDAYALEVMSKTGEIKGCMVGGPFALDNAISEEAAKHKGMDHPIGGKADILLAPDIEAGNILYKSIVFIAKAKNAGLIVGARKPIVLTSRADSNESKLRSIALGVLASNQ